MACRPDLTHQGILSSPWRIPQPRHGGQLRPWHIQWVPPLSGAVRLGWHGSLISASHQPQQWWLLPASAASVAAAIEPSPATQAIHPIHSPPPARGVGQSRLGRGPNWSPWRPNLPVCLLHLQSQQWVWCGWAQAT